MPLTDNPQVVADAVIDYLNEGLEDLGIRRVWYGEDVLIPETPAIAVTPGNMTSTLAETGPMLINQMPIILSVFHSRLDNQEISRRECDIKAQEVKEYLHQKPKLGGVVIFGYVSSVEPGFTTRNRTFVRTTRLTLSTMSKTRML